MNYQNVYPDVYYKVQPFVMMACDEMDALNLGVPTYDTVREVSDQIYGDVIRIHPDLAEQGSDSMEMFHEAAAAYDMPEPYVTPQRWRGGGGGIFRDLIDILLLNEIFRRRRRY
jgi:hypothetical protein